MQVTTVDKKYLLRKCANPVCNNIEDIARRRFTKDRCGTCYAYYNKHGTDRTWSTYEEGKKRGGFKAGRKYVPYEKCKVDECFDNGRGGGTRKGYCKLHRHIGNEKKPKQPTTTVIQAQQRTYCPCCGRKLIIKCSGSPDCKYDGSE